MVVVDDLNGAAVSGGVILDSGRDRLRRSIRRQTRHDGGRLHAWCDPQFIEKALIGRTARVGVVWFGQRHRERHQARSIESRIDAREVVDRSDQQSRASDEHHCQRDFDDNERAADVIAPTAARRSVPALLERGHEVVHPSLRNRREAKEHARRQ